MCKLIEKCRQLEESSYKVDSIGNKIMTNMGCLITSNFDVILELCNKHLYRDFILPYTFNDNNILISCRHTNEKHINIILTNSYLLPFWEICLMESNNILKNMNCIIINNLQKFEKSNITHNIDTCIILTPEMMKKLWNNHTFFREIKFDRIILHGLDNYDILNKFSVLFGFKWIVTNHISLIDNLLKSDHLCVMNNLIIEDENSKLNSIIDYKYIYSKRPIASVTLDGLVEKTIIDGLESYDIKKIIKHLSSPLIKTEPHVLKHVLKRFNDNLSVIEENEIYIQRMEYANNEDKQQRLDNISKIKKTLNDKKEELIKRITNYNLCFICYDDIDIKCVLKCCANVVCFQCINKWLQRSDICPLCKVDKFKYLIVEDESIQEKNETISKSTLSKNNNIFQNFYILVNQLLLNNETQKTLIVGQDDMMLNRFKTVLHNNKINYLDFKGNIFILKKVLKRFTHNDMNILFLNTSMISCGIPLSCITDIIFLSNNTQAKGIISECHNIKSVWTLMYSDV
jgi:hypothetical protein